MNIFLLLFYNRTIPISEDGENDPKYRLTEDLTSYLNCRVRSRNKNLFTANRVRKIKNYRHLTKKFSF